MKKKICKKFLGFLLSALLVLAVSLPAFADMGPKPSVELKLYVYNDQNYAVTLLGNTESTGPWSAPNDYQDWMGSRSVWEAFKNYDAPEGYYFLGYFKEYFGDTEQTFTWGYYPPQKFYVLLYNMDTGAFSLSREAVERYAFDSTWQVLFDTEDGDLRVYTNRDDGDLISFFAARLLITLMLELGRHPACAESCAPLRAVLSGPVGGLCALRRDGDSGLCCGSLCLLPLAAVAGGQEAPPRALRAGGQPTLLRGRLGAERASDQLPAAVAGAGLSAGLVHHPASGKESGKL